MYRDHFALTELPFGLTPNTSFYFGLPPHEEALAVLRCAINAGEGFIKVIGEVGTGKTLVCRKLMNDFDEWVQCLWLPNPVLNPSEFRMAIALELGLYINASVGQDLTDRIHRRLIELKRQGKQIVLLIDEAQALPDATMEAVRLFGNLETESSKLLQIVLFGQPELEQRLNEPHLRQLRQRIGFSCTLRPLTFDESRAYIQHRLNEAGAQGRSLFTQPAFWLLWRSARGIPRLIHQLAHKGLIYAYGKNQPRVTFAGVRHAVRDTQDATLPHWLRGRYWLLGGMAILMVYLITHIDLHDVMALYRGLTR